MTRDAVESLRVNLDDLAGVLATLDEAEWESPSACAGWRVQDLVAHMNSSAKLMTGQQAPPAVEGDRPGAESLAELLIEEQKAWSWEQVYAEFGPLNEGFLAAVGMMQEDPVASTEADLGDLGVHQTHWLANAFAFDTYCHLRHDILGPDTSIERELPASTDDRLRPGLDWMLAGLPQMCRDALAPVVTGVIQFELTGPGGGTWTMAPAGSDGLVSIAEGPAEADATVVSSAHDFYSWGTKRSDWRNACELRGDADLAAAVLDAINVI